MHVKKKRIGSVVKSNNNNRLHDNTTIIKIYETAVWNSLENLKNSKNVIKRIVFVPGILFNCP